MNELKGTLGFKGERGYSAYEIALQNGYIGTEKDWLAQLGTSSNFNQYREVYTTISEESTHPLPSQYTTGCLLDIYVNGDRLNLNQYSIQDNTIIFEPAIPSDSTVELVVLLLTTNNLPIVQAIDEHSTEDTVPSSKLVYEIKQELKDSALFFASEEEWEDIYV